MRLIMASAIGIGIWLGVAGESHAQFSLGIGNLYNGSGLYINSSPYGYGSPGIIGGTGYYNSGYLGGPAAFSYNSGYVGGPGAFAYSSGYAGYGPGYGVGYAARPYYRNYGVANYGYRYGNGFRPFQPFRRYYR